MRTLPSQRDLPIVEVTRSHGRAYAVTDPAVRFWSKVEIRKDGCWWWTGTISDGYGKFALTHSQAVFAHRYSYEAMVGKVPEGLQLDHLCRNRACVRPSHLEPVTSKENRRRGIGVDAVNAAKTHCLRGHPLSGDNLYQWRGKRHCRTCRQIREGTRWARKEGDL